VRRSIHSIGLTAWIFSLTALGLAQDPALSDSRWIGDEVLPKLEAMKSKANKDLVAAETKISNARTNIRKATALEDQYKNLGDTTAAQGAREVVDIAQQTKKKAEAWKERSLLNKQRAVKAIESVTYTLAHNLGGNADAVSSGVTGDVKISRAGKFVDLYGSDGDYLVPGDKIETGADGKIDLVMKDGHKIHLEPHSTMTFEKDAVTLLDEGFLAARRLALEKLAKKFEVRTPSCAIAVRGTEYSIRSAPEGTTIEVHEGSVEVWDPKKTTSAVVEAGFKVYVPKDGLPGTPEKDDTWKSLDWDAPIAGE